MSKKKLRRSGAKIMASLILLLGSLSYIMLLAVLNGSLGFVAAMGVTIFGALGVAKALGESIALSYGFIIGLAVGCGLLRGGLRYIEQYSNHYIAFRLLAVLRDKIFGALRILCPAKLESKQKGSIIAMITSDIETLEVFYAHTISPICIAFIVSVAVLLFVGFVSSPYLALVALVGYITIGVIVPLISSGWLKESGVKYRAEFASFNAYFLDSIKGIKDIVLNNAGEERKAEVNRRSDELLKETKRMKHRTTRASSFTELSVSLFILITLAVGILLVHYDMLSIGYMIVGVVAVFGSFGPVIAVSALPGNLTQTFASGDRVLNLLSERPAVRPIQNGKKFDYENLEVKDLSFGYEKDVSVLQNICLNAKKGEIIGIVGESGCGKSTLLKLLLRFWQKDSGRIEYNGMLFMPTVEKEILFGAKSEVCAREMIKLFGLEKIKNRHPQSLSEGQKRRVSIAAVAAAIPDVLLLDEPTVGQDYSGLRSLVEILNELHDRTHNVMITVTHDMRCAEALCDRAVWIENGIVKAEGGKELTHTYFFER